MGRMRGGQVWASDKNDPGSKYILYSSFATDLGSNFFILVEITSTKNILNKLEKLFHFNFGAKDYL